MSLGKLTEYWTVVSSIVKFLFMDGFEFIVNVACLVKSLNEAPVLGVKGLCNKCFNKASKKPNEFIE